MVEQKQLTMLMAASAFMLVLSLWLVIVLLWSWRRAKRNLLMKRRLEMAGTNGAGQDGRVLRLWHEGREATTLVPVLRAQQSFARFRKLLTDAGIETPVSRVLLGLAVSLVAVAAGAYAYSQSPVVAAVSPIGVLIVLWLLVTNRISKRTMRFEQQLVDALELSARSLRVGHPLIGSFRLISEEIPAPVGDLFGEVCQQEALGMSMDQALHAVSNDTQSEDLKLFATSVVIQLRTGGNLADMMQRLAKIIRERSRLARRVRVMTAQTQFSKRILLSLPFLIFLGMNLLDPGYMNTLYVTAFGRALMALSAVLMVMGWLTMNWLSRLTP